MKELLEALDGSCKTPVGAYAKIDKNGEQKIMNFRYLHPH